MAKIYIKFVVIEHFYRNQFKIDSYRSHIQSNWQQQKSDTNFKIMRLTSIQYKSNNVTTVKFSMSFHTAQ